MLEDQREQLRIAQESNWIGDELLQRLSFCSRLPLDIETKRRMLNGARRRFEMREKGGQSKFVYVLFGNIYFGFQQHIY